MTKTIVVKVVLTKLLLESLPATAFIATAAALTDAFAETAKTTTTTAASSEEVFNADRPFSPNFAIIEGYHRP